jgi:hypothetical protein
VFKGAKTRLPTARPYMDDAVFIFSEAKTVLAEKLAQG